MIIAAAILIYVFGLGACFMAMVAASEREPLAAFMLLALGEVLQGFAFAVLWRTW